MATSAKKKVRKYSIECLQLGFMAYPPDERLPLCLLGEQTLYNESMKLAKLEAHLKAKHVEHVDENLAYYQRLKTAFEKRKQKTINAMFKAQTSLQDNRLVASYELSLLIATCGKAYTVGEDLIKPALTIFTKSVLKRNDDPASVIPLSNDSVRRLVDEMASDVENQLIRKLRVCKFTAQLDESTVRESETLLLVVYVRISMAKNFKNKCYFVSYLPQRRQRKIFTKYLYNFWMNRKSP